METKQRTGNEVTDRAKVQSRFCSHLSDHFPIPRARLLLHVPRFCNILLNTISQLDRVLCFVKK